MLLSLKRKSATAVALILSLTLTACGTILYPERKGQVSGQIDPAIAVMDGIGLLFFLVPGVIAFAVDFSNGTIYLPHGKRSRLTTSELQQYRAGKLQQSEIASRLAHQPVAQKQIIAQRATDLKRVEQYLDGPVAAPAS